MPSERRNAFTWPVLIDDLAGTVQRAYGGLAAAVYLIDSRGTVAFCGTWGQSPALRHAIDELLARGGAAPCRKGHRSPAASGRGDRGRTGWPHSRRQQALIDLELGFPGAMILMTLGRVARPVLAPLALRTTPLPKRGTRRSSRRPCRRTGVAVGLPSFGG